MTKKCDKCKKKEAVEKLGKLNLCKDCSRILKAPGFLDEGER